jgi:polyhydroxyalkanoate synthesis regulator phasin
MDFIDDLGEGLNKLFLAGVGAVAMGAEMSGALIDELVKKGEETVEQGKSLNEELSKKAMDTVDSTHDAFLKARMQTMSDEEREAFVARIIDMNNEINENSADEDAEETDTVEVIVEDVAEEAAEDEE